MVNRFSSTVSRNGAPAHDPLTCDLGIEYCAGCRAEAEGHLGAISHMRNRAADDEQNSPAADDYAEPAVEFAGLRFRDFAAATYRRDFRIDGVLVAGQSGIIAGVEKTLKTSVVMDAAVSMSAAVPFLGVFAVTVAAKVGIMSGESGPATLQETAIRVCKAKGIDPAQLDYPRMCFDVPTLNDLRHLDGLKAFIEDGELDVLFLDPTYLCLLLGNEAGNLFTVGALLKRVSELSRQTGCDIHLVHHCKHPAGGDSYAPPELRDILWAGYKEWARQWWLLGRREAFDPESDGEHKLWLSVGGSAGHYGRWAVDVTEGRLKDPGGRRWDVQVSSASAAREAKKNRQEEARRQQTIDKQRERREKLLHALAKHPDGETMSRLSELTGIMKKLLAPITEELLQGGEIEPCQVIKGKCKYPGYRLPRIRSDRSDLSGSVRPYPG